MRLFSTLFANLTGSFPSIAAKNATTVTALDGTEWEKKGIDDLLFGPLQAEFNAVGATPDGNPELYNDSQVLDVRRQLYAMPVKQTVSATGTLTLGKTNHLIELDTSLGNITATLPNGDFTGQHIEVYTTGSGVAQIAGTGLDTNNIYQTEGTGKLNIVWDGSQWVADNQKTAEVDDGYYLIEYYSDGSVYFFGNDAGTITVNTALGNIYTGSLAVTWPLTLSETPVDVIGTANQSAGWIGNYSAISTTGASATGFRGTTGTISFNTKVKGKY